MRRVMRRTHHDLLLHAAIREPRTPLGAHGARPRGAREAGSCERPDRSSPNERVRDPSTRAGLRQCRTQPLRNSTSGRSRRPPGDCSRNQSLARTKPQTSMRRLVFELLFEEAGAAAAGCIESLFARRVPEAELADFDSVIADCLERRPAGGLRARSSRCDRSRTSDREPRRACLRRWRRRPGRPSRKLTVAAPEQRARAEENECGRHRQREVGIGEQAERVQDDHEQRGQRRSQSASSLRAVSARRDRSSRARSRRSVEETSARAGSAGGRAGEFPRRSGNARKSASRSRRIALNRGRLCVAEHEVMMCRRGPDVANSVVRASRSRRSDLRGWAGPPSDRKFAPADRRHRLGLMRPCDGGERKNDLLSCCQTVSSTPDAYLPGCLLDGLTTGIAQDRVVAVPAEDLVGQHVEVLVDPEASAREDLVERDAVRLVRVARQ